MTSRHERRIMSLPKFASQGKMNAAIHLPEAQDEDLKIVLNLAPQSRNVLDGTMNLADPMIVWRNLQTVLQGRNVSQHVLMEGGASRAIESVPDEDNDCG
jgi:hypothetical protein